MIAALRAVFIFAPRASGGDRGNVGRRASAPRNGVAPSRPLDEADADLVTRLRHGDADALGVLFRAYYAPLCAYAARQVGDPAAGEEIVMELFHRIWERHDTVVLRGPWRTYLFGAVHHAILNARRDRHTRVRLMAEHHSDAVPALGAAPVSPVANVERTELRTAIAATVATLPDRVRVAFGLRWESGLSGREIAAIMGVSDKAAEQYLVRAARALRVALRRFRDG